MPFEKIVVLRYMRHHLTYTAVSVSKYSAVS